jgi:hypothetical protein
MPPVRCDVRLNLRTWSFNRSASAAADDGSEVGADGNAKEKPDERIDPSTRDNALREGARGPRKVPQKKSADQREVAEDRHESCFAIAEATGCTHASRLLSGSSVEAVPDHQRHLDDHHGEGDCNQIPADDVIVEVAILKEPHSDQRGDNPADAGGAAAMLKESLINKLANEWNAAEDRMGHDRLSN